MSEAITGAIVALEAKRDELERKREAIDAVIKDLRALLDEPEVETPVPQRKPTQRLVVAPPAPARLVTEFGLTPCSDGAVAILKSLGDTFTLGDLIPKLGGCRKRAYKWVHTWDVKNWIDKLGGGEYRKVKAAGNGSTESRPTVAPPRPFVPNGKLSHLVETECAKAMRRAISVVATVKERFNRDDICHEMTKFVGERSMKGWLQSGSVPATMITLREQEMITFIEHKPPAQAVYQKGDRFLAVT